MIAEQNSIAEAAKFAGRLHDLQSDLLAVPANEEVPLNLQKESIFWSRVLAPLHNDPTAGRMLSRERGQLLTVLVESPGNTAEVIAKGNFSYSDLKDARFDVDQPKLVDCVLLGARFDGANLSNAELREAYLVKATLIGTILTGAKVSNADATGADFSNCDLRKADLRETILDDAILAGARLEGAIVDDDRWLELQRQRAKPPKGLSWSSWVIERDPEGLFRLKPKK